MALIIDNWCNGVQIKYAPVFMSHFICQICLQVDSTNFTNKNVVLS